MRKQLNSYEKGLWGEFLARIYLRLHGYRIRAIRYKTGYGEIDIVAQKGSQLVFVEVKYRKDIDNTLEMLSRKTYQRRLLMASKQYISRHAEVSSYDYRHDVVILKGLLGLPPIHLQNCIYDE